MSTEDVHAALLDDLIRRRGVVMLIGARDTGKTSFARKLTETALAAGRTIAYIDADPDQSTTGPPTCTGLKFIESQADLDDISNADRLHFVGSIGVEGVLLQQVVATAALVANNGAEARAKRSVPREATTPTIAATPSIILPARRHVHASLDGLRWRLDRRHI